LAFINPNQRKNIMRSTKLNQITLCADGSIGLQLLKMIADGDNVISKEPHRVVIQPDELAEDVLSYVNPHLEQMGFPSITAEEVAHVDTMAVAHRLLPSVAAGVDAYKQTRADAIAAAEAAEAERQRLADEAEAEAERQAEIDAAAEAQRQAAAEAKAAEDADAKQAAEDERIQRMIKDGVAAALAANNK
jgi:hypothetical protein